MGEQTQSALSRLLYTYFFWKYLSYQ